MLALATLLMHIDEVAALVRVGITSVRAVSEAVAAGKITVHDAGGGVLKTEADLHAGVDRAKARWAQVSDEAAARLERLPLPAPEGVTP